MAGALKHDARGVLFPLRIETQDCFLATTSCKVVMFILMIVHQVQCSGDSCGSLCDYDFACEIGLSNSLDLVQIIVNTQIIAQAWPIKLPRRENSTSQRKTCLLVSSERNGDSRVFELQSPIV